MISAIIVAAGMSRRMGFDKIFSTLMGKPVLEHSLRAFQDCPDVARIVVVTRPEKIAEVEAICGAAGISKLEAVVPGGGERHMSVWHGLQAVKVLDAEYIAIHDGARPLVTPDLITRCLKLAKKHGAASCATQIPETVKRACESDMVTESVDRTGLWAMQTPQVFSNAVILQAYAAVIAHHELVTDEVSAVERIGKRVALLRNDEWNLKITVPRDLEMAEHILAARSKSK